MGVILRSKATKNLIVTGYPQRFFAEFILSLSKGSE
jgi:hypothetical protein